MVESMYEQLNRLQRQLLELAEVRNKLTPGTEEHTRAQAELNQVYIEIIKILPRPRFPRD